MSPQEPHERELQALAGLSPVAPADAFERRVHARCRAALVNQPGSRGVAPRLLDAALVMAIGLYLAAAATEALRLVAAG